MGGKEIEKDDSKPVLYRLVMRTVLFFALFLFSLLVFYAIGNYQNFLDENQYLILTAASLAAIMLFVFSVWGFAVSLFYALKKDSPHRALHRIRGTYAFYGGFRFCVHVRIPSHRFSCGRNVTDADKGRMSKKSASHALSVTGFRSVK